MHRINFFTPTLNKTGSEIALLNLINSATDTFEMRVVSNFSGKLSSELSSKVPLLNIESYNSIFSESKSNYVQLANKALKYFKTDERFLQRFHKKYPADIWYINTIMLPNVVSFASNNKIPFILHVHELEQLFVNLTAQQFQNVVKYPSLIIACSNTCANAIKLSGRTDNIEICYPAINFSVINPDHTKTSMIRKTYNISDDTFLWIMSGTMDLNKNPSIFVDIASRILKVNNKARFMWLVNVAQDNGYVSYCKAKSVQLNIADKIIWVSDLDEEYYNYFNAGDGFVLTSFKESFSMVSAEALYLGKPVVSFDCGGIKEIVSDNTGIIIDNYKINSLVDTMLQIMNKELVFNSEQARTSVKRFDISIQKKIWSEVITRYL